MVSRLFLVLGAVLFGILPAAAQNNLFPQTLPPNVVVGRLGIGPGPAQAIPFANLFNNLPGSALLASMPAFTTLCNPAGIPGPVQACAAVTAAPPLGISGTTVNINTDSTLHNIAVGSAQNGTATGNSNIAVGFGSQASLTGGISNNSLGVNSCNALTSGSNNFCLGTNSGLNITSGSSIVAIGSGAFGTGTTSVQDVAIGGNALAVATGDNNTAVGYRAGVIQTTAASNVIVGAFAGQNITTGGTNTIVGTAAAGGLTTGVKNSIFGPCTGLAAALSNAIMFCDGDGNIRLNWDNTAGNWVQKKTDFTDQIYSTTGPPTIASGACGTTTNGTVGAGSTNQSGFINIGAVATTTCTLSWSATLSVAPNSCVFFPGNAAAAATGTTAAWAGAPSMASVVLNGSALANTTYRYLCL